MNKNKCCNKCGIKLEDKNWCPSCQSKRDYICKTCLYNRRKKWGERTGYNYWQEQYKFINRLKINGCAICGYNKCNAALDFHHVEKSNKKFRFTRCLSDEHTIEEFHKCILLCSNCHREIHAKEMTK